MAEVRRCHLTACSLHPFRMGRNPYHASSRENRRASPSATAGEPHEVRHTAHAVARGKAGRKT